mgnify:CR=1 FL=1
MAAMQHRGKIHGQNLPAMEEFETNAFLDGEVTDGEDVFVHYSNIEGEGYRSLDEGQNVEFEVGLGRKAPEALGVLHERCQPSHKTGQPPTSCTLVTAPVRFLAGGFADGHWFFRST